MQMPSACDFAGTVGLEFPYSYVWRPADCQPEHLISFPCDRSSRLTWVPSWGLQGCLQQDRASWVLFRPLLVLCLPFETSHAAAQIQRGWQEFITVTCNVSTCADGSIFITNFKCIPTFRPRSRKNNTLSSLYAHHLDSTIFSILLPFF